MFNWIKELIEIKHQARERKLRLLAEHEGNKNKCQSCEVLKETVDRLRFENDRLFNELLKKNTDTTPVSTQPPIPLTPPRGHIPWAVRRQMLEAEDREKAKLMREAPKESTTDLEKELDLAESTRQNTTGI